MPEAVVDRVGRAERLFGVRARGGRDAGPALFGSEGAVAAPEFVTAWGGAAGRAALPLFISRLMEVVCWCS
ncbi:MAG: hypothetical protein AB1816_01265 [Bacillota bacterium]